MIRITSASDDDYIYGVTKKFANSNELELEKGKDRWIILGKNHKAANDWPNQA